MVKKTSEKKSSRASSGSANHGVTGLIGMARTIGETLGAVAATAGEAAKDFETFTKSVRKSTVGTTRKLYKRVQKSVGVAPASKSGAKKKSPAKKAGTKKKAGQGK